jgi:hypothetical protein
VAGPTLTTEAIVLLKRPPAENFQSLGVFSAEHGVVTVLQRISKKNTARTTSLDLFDEASLLLESSNQGATWFVKEVQLHTRHAEIGRNYEALQLASSLALLVSRNLAPEESRGRLYTLLQQAFAAFGTSSRPDIVYFKSLYRFARDEGHPVKQQWFPTLPSADRSLVIDLINRPLLEQTAPPAEVARLQRRLENYLRGHTEILLD